MKSSDVEKAAALLLERAALKARNKQYGAATMHKIEFLAQSEILTVDDADEEEAAFMAILKTVDDKIEAIEAKLRALGVELETLRRVVNEPGPLERGAFVGDTYFGDPNDSATPTHSWNGSAWAVIR